MSAEKGSKAISEARTPRKELRELTQAVHASQRRVKGSYAYLNPKAVQRYLSEKAFLNLPNMLYRAAVLVIMGLCSLRIAAQATGETKSAVQRAVEAIRLGREPGKNGRPCSATLDVMEKFLKWALTQVDTEMHPDLSVIHAKVSSASPLK